MYPKSFVDLFGAFPRNQNVFVAMSFHHTIKLRYEAVIKPAIERCGLVPVRVDKSQINDSILTDILKGITDSLLIFVDLTGPAGMASPNVMYEVGLAHAIRLPVEVILFRSDDGHPPFDLANVRLKKYDPDSEPEHAQQLIEAAISNARRELDNTQHLIVTDLADQLTHEAAVTLLAADQPWDVPLSALESNYDIRSRGDFRSQLRELLETRLLQCVFEDGQWIKDAHWLKPMELVRITPLGRAVSAKVGERTSRGEAVRERTRQSIDRDLVSNTTDHQFFLSFRQNSHHMPEMTEDEKKALLDFVKKHAVGDRVHRESTQIDYLVERYEKEIFWPVRRAAEGG